MIMICGKERKIILDHIYRRCLYATSAKKPQSQTRKLAQLAYENMPKKEKIKIYNQEIDSKIVEYLIKQAEDSLCFNIGPNCTPEKRSARIREWAFNLARNMPRLEKAAICEKLNIKLI